jgi:RimJ/RimL family protein N-acetyltransferase
MTPRHNAYGQPIGHELPGWTPRPAPTPVTLEGRYCSLVPVDAARHAPALFEAFAATPDGRDWTDLSVGPFADCAAYAQYLAKAAMSRDPLHHTIIDRATGLPAGTLALMRIDPGNGVIEVGSVTYSRALQRQRAGSEAQYLLMRHVFEDLGYRRYEWKCDALNAPSRRAAERFGFTFEGIFRQAIVTKGRNRDTAWYSILDHEWPARKRRFERWLAPDNFAPDGSQRSRLADLD